MAALLDQLAGVYDDEDPGRPARELTVRIYGRLGIGVLIGAKKGARA